MSDVRFGPGHVNPTYIKSDAFTTLIEFLAKHYGNKTPLFSTHTCAEANPYGSDILVPTIRLEIKSSQAFCNTVFTLVVTHTYPVTDPATVILELDSKICFSGQGLSSKLITDTLCGLMRPVERASDGTFMLLPDSGNPVTLDIGVVVSAIENMVARAHCGWEKLYRFPNTDYASATY